jgi:hypothetical protein
MIMQETRLKAIDSESCVVHRLNISQYRIIDKLGGCRIGRALGKRCRGRWPEGEHPAGKTEWDKESFAITSGLV